MAVTYKDFGFEKQTSTIDDRIKLVHLKRPNSVFSIIISLKAGALYQPKSGLAHFVEHMLCKESKKYPNWDDYKKVVLQSAAYVNATTSPDRMNMIANVPETADAPQIIDMLIDQINSPLMKSERIEKERTAIQQELRMNEKNISSVNYCNLLCLMMNKKGDFIYPVSGSIEQVAMLTKQDLLDYYAALRSQKVYITSTGSMDIVQINEFIDKNLQLNEFHELKSNTVSHPQAKAVIASHKDKNNNIILRLGQRIKRADYIEDQAGISLVMTYLYGQKGQMIEKLRYELGLVYGVTGEYYLTEDFGVIVSWTECSKENLPRVIEIMKQEFARLQANELDTRKIDEIKQMMAKRLRSRLEKSIDVTHSFVDSNLGGKLDPIELINAVEKVSADDIMQVAKKYLQTPDMLWSFTGDLEEKDIRELGIKGEVECI